jgi:hypothetical protein
MVELRHGAGPRQRIWDLIRHCHVLSNQSFELRAVTPGDVARSSARDYLDALCAAGYVERVADRPVAWRLVRDHGIEAPRVRKDGSPVTMGMAQENMWNTLRRLAVDFNARELAAHASTAAIPVAESAAGDYLRNLERAGYLVRTRAGKGAGRGGVQARYRLLPARNTEPKPPMVCRTNVIFDPNEGRVAWCPVTEETAIYGR